ncbi:putative uncharacterized protein [Roseburia sp. CAG:303]|nr:putative uncharacterized protein [Roseburia sp. CAG:303]
MAPVRSYTNWNCRENDAKEQIEPYRKYFFICEGANTETWYFRKLIDIRKSLNIHPLIDIRLLEKTDEDKDISFPRKLITFAESQKDNQEIAFELFLLLHFENSYEQEILPNQDKIIANQKEGNQTFIYKLLLSKTGVNSKKNPQIGELAEKVDIAIRQEKKMNEDIHDCKGKITCNIGKIIESIRMDKEI